MKSDGTWRRLLPIIPLVPYWWLVITYASDFPIWDDYDAVLRFLNSYIQAPVGDKLTLIFEQHNEHRILPIRLFVILQYLLFGTISLKWLVYISNIFLSLFYVAIWVGLSRLWGRGLDTSLLVTAFGVILLQPQYGDGMIWTSTALTSFSLAFFAAIAFLQLQPQNLGALFLSFLFASFSVFTQGNGALVPVIGVFLLFLRKRAKQALLYAAGGAVILTAFFYGYVDSPHYGPLDGLKANGVFGVIDYFLTFVGAVWGGSAHFPSAIAGGLFFVLGTFGFIRSGPSRSALFTGLFAFAGGSAALSSLIRSASGITFALSPGRYTVISVIFSISALALFILSLKTRRDIAVKFLFIVSLLFGYLSYSWYTSELGKLQSKLILDMAEWVSSGTQGLTYPSFEHGDKVLKASLQNGVYEVPKADYGNISNEDLVSTAKKEKDRIVAALNRFRIGEKFLLAEGFAFIRKIPSSESDVYLVFRSTSGHTITFKPRSMDRTADLGARFRNDDRGKSGFLALLQVELFKPGERYGFSFAVRHKGEVYIRETGQSVTIKAS